VLAGLGHLDLVCSDLERSLAFYGTVFGPLGLQPPVTFPGERGEPIHYLRFPTPGSGSLGLRKADEAQEFELYAPGFHHLALTVDTREDVDAAHAAAAAAGAEVLHAPRLWPQYHPEYYVLALRIWFLALDRVEQLDEAVSEHSELLEAIRAGDGTRAERSMRRHVQGFEQAVRKVL